MHTSKEQPATESLKLFIPRKFPAILYWYIAADGTLFTSGHDSYSHVVRRVVYLVKLPQVVHKTKSLHE